MAQGAVKKSGKRSQAVSAKKEAILAAALEAFSQFGIHGTRLEQVAERAGVSKTNLLYYYPSKEALYVAVLQQILAIWLAPLKAFREDISPLVAIREYIRLKLEVSRDHPQASKLFCLEMLQGAPLLMGELTGDLKALVDEKSAIVSGWIDRGKLAPVDPQHLIFMIWLPPSITPTSPPRWRRSPAPRCRMRPFFEQTVDNVQRMIIEGIRVR
ncbi:Transcriptional regulator RutR of pyrimidine catabolism (TetR family) [Klebsiella pneumoniae IS39]|nr:Transcriptional regulator RutR of pyrimidine catabolism (TetR family) [Klebsiella pneumoniae IS39]